MKTRIYFRIAKLQRSNQLVVVHARTKPHYGAIEDANGRARPTVAFALDIDIPDKAFKMAEQAIATVELLEDQLEIVAQVKSAQVKPI